MHVQQCLIYNLLYSVGKTGEIKQIGPSYRDDPIMLYCKNGGGSKLLYNNVIKFYVLYSAE